MLDKDLDSATIFYGCFRCNDKKNFLVEVIVINPDRKLISHCFVLVNLTIRASLIPSITPSITQGPERPFHVVEKAS